MNFNQSGIEFKSINACCFHSVIKEIIKPENRNYSLELPLLSLITSSNCPFIKGLLVEKHGLSSYQENIAFNHEVYWNEIDILSSQIQSLDQLALGLSLILEVIDEDDLVTEYISNFIHTFYFKISIKENRKKVYTLLECKINFYLKKPLINTSNQNINNTLRNFEQKLKKLLDSKNVVNEPRINQNIFVGQIEGNSIKLFSIKKNNRYVRPTLHKLEDLKNMLSSQEYTVENMGSKEFNMNFEFPDQQCLPESSEFLNGHH